MKKITKGFLVGCGVFTLFVLGYIVLSSTEKEEKQIATIQSFDQELMHGLARMQPRRKRNTEQSAKRWSGVCKTAEELTPYLTYAWQGTENFPYKITFGTLSFGVGVGSYGKSYNVPSNGLCNETDGITTHLTVYVSDTGMLRWSCGDVECSTQAGYCGDNTVQEKNLENDVTEECDGSIDGCGDEAIGCDGCICIYEDILDAICGDGKVDEGEECDGNSNVCESNAIDCNNLCQCVYPIVVDDPDRDGDGKPNEYDRCPDEGYHDCGDNVSFDWETGCCEKSGNNDDNNDDHSICGSSADCNDGAVCTSDICNQGKCFYYPVCPDDKKCEIQGTRPNQWPECK